MRFTVTGSPITLLLKKSTSFSCEKAALKYSGSISICVIGNVTLPINSRMSLFSRPMVWMESLGPSNNFTNGYEALGINAARVLERDIYGGAASPRTLSTVPGLRSSSRRQPRFLHPHSASKFGPMLLRSRLGAEADFALFGSTVSVTIQAGQSVMAFSNYNFPVTAPAPPRYYYTGHAGDGRSR